MESCMKDKDLKVVVMWDLEVLWVAFFITRVDGRSVCSWTNPTNAPGTRRDEGILGNVDQSHLALVPLPVGVRGSPRRLQPRFHLLQELTWLSALQRLNNALPSHLSGGFRGGYIPFIRGCFPLTAQISKMQMHLEMPPHFPPSRRRWAVPMLCINKRFIRRVSVRHPAKFGTLIFHWGPEVWVEWVGVGLVGSHEEHLERYLWCPGLMWGWKQMGRGRAAAGCWSLRTLMKLPPHTEASPRPWKHRWLQISHVITNTTLTHCCFLWCWRVDYVVCVFLWCLLVAMAASGTEWQTFCLVKWTH